ncbi:tyrosinase 2 [Colletotrichum higginsianum]|nr:tyrosinase 2 [Colletotrichum higginsianum]
MTALQFILVFGVLSAVQWFAAAQEIPVAGVRSGVNTRTGEMPIRRNINSVFDERGPQWYYPPLRRGLLSLTIP